MKFLRVIIFSIICIIFYVFFGREESIIVLCFIHLLFALVESGATKDKTENITKETTEKTEYKLVPLENTDRNKVFYLFSNNNGTYTYYYTEYDGIDYYYQKGMIEEYDELIIKPLADYPKIVKTTTITHDDTFEESYFDKNHISYTVYAPLGNIFDEFKLDSGAETSIK